MERSCWLFGIKQSFASHFKSEIENWPNIFQAISYWFNIFSGKHPCQKNKSNNQNYGWLMAGWLASQCMHCIMLYDLDILTKSKQIDEKYIPINTMLGFNPALGLKPSLSLPFDCRTLEESKSPKSIFRRKKFCLLVEKKGGLCGKHQL